MRRFLLDILVPAVLGIGALLLIDALRGETSPWWAVALIVAAAFALWDGARHLVRRSRSRP